MAIVRNNFSGTLSSLQYQTYTITGLTSETSSHNFSCMYPEMSLQILNSLYQTLIDAGYDDTVKNETEYSITVLGFKFFVLACAYNNSSNFVKRIAPEIIPYGSLNGSALSFFSSSGGDGINNESDYNYSITVRGDENHISIYNSSYSYPSVDYTMFCLSKGKKLVDNTDIYLFGQSISGVENAHTTSNSSTRKWCMCKKDDVYNIFYNSSSTPLHSPYTNKGYNEDAQFVCVPQLGMNGTLYFPSMIQGNTAMFAVGKYYKIGSDKYFNEGGYLYKVG